MIEFLKTYWKELAIFIVTLGCFILQVFRKRGKTDPAIEKVHFALPSIINDAERLFDEGLEKKEFALTRCFALYKALTGVTLEHGSHIAKVFSDAIEDILSTPQKKGKL